MNATWINDYWYIIALVALWEMTWKALALWRAAQNGDKPWFIILFIVNSVGILPIAYIVIFSKRQKPAKDRDELGR